MAKVAITEQYLEDIADAIREKTGLSNTFFPSEMAPAILTISGSGGITPTGTITITENDTYDVTRYASAVVNVSTGSTINNQNKSVTPTKLQQQITYDSGYTGLDTVTVNAIPANYIEPMGTLSITSNGTQDVTEYASVSVNVPTGSTINNQDKTVNPSTSQQSITADSGYTGLGTVTVNAMPAGTAGTPTASKGTVSNHSISVTPSVTNTTGYITGSTKTGTAVTVSASELVSGTKSISANGTNIDVTNYAAVDVAVGGGGYVTQAADGSVTFSATDGPPTLISKSITQNGTYDPTSDNADGYSSVTVNVSEGGISGVVKGTLSVPTTINTSTRVDIINISSIGFTPTQFIFYKNEDTKTNNAVYFASYSNFDSHYLRARAVYSRQDGFTLRNSAVTDWTTSSSGYLYYYSSTGAIQYSATSSYILEAGTYTWIAIE